MKSLLVAVGMIALAAPAAADTLTLPGTELALSLPDGSYTLADVDTGGGGKQSMIVSLDHGVFWWGKLVPGSCDDMLSATAKDGSGTVEDASEVPAGWSTHRSHADSLYLYCHGIGDNAVLAFVISHASTDADRDARVRTMLEAISAALPAPVSPVRLTIAGVGSVSLPGDHFLLVNGDVMSMTFVRFTANSNDGDCADLWSSTAKESGTTMEPVTGLPSAWSPQRAHGDDDTTFMYCREIGSRFVGLIVESADAKDVPAEVMVVTEAIDEQLAGSSSGSIETASASASSADSSADAPTDTASAPSASPDVPASTSATDDDDHAGGSGTPATYDAARWSLAGGQSSLDMGAGTHVYGAARVAITPRYLDDDYADSGVAIAAGASMGAAGDAFVGDSYASAGYGVGRGALTARALFAMGVDRVGGGFEPQIGVYGGVQGFVRVGFGSFSVEGDGMATRSTSADETRAQVGVVTHVGDRVLAIDGFYTRWDAVATIYGVSLGLTR